MACSAFFDDLWFTGTGSADDDPVTLNVDFLADFVCDTVAAKCPPPAPTPQLTAAEVCAMVAANCPPSGGTLDLCSALSALTAAPAAADCTGGLLVRQLVTSDCDTIPYCVVKADAANQTWDDQNPGWVDPATVPRFCRLELCNGHTGDEIWVMLHDTQGAPQWHQEA